MLETMDWFSLAVCVLATYRLSQLVSKDTGPTTPLYIFDTSNKSGFIDSIRRYARKRTGYYQGISKNNSLELSEKKYAEFWFIFWKDVSSWLECPYCNGIWFAALSFILVQFTIGKLFLIWLAISGGQAFLQDLRG